MNICNDQHDEICFESRKCPLCAMINELNEEIANLNYKIEELKANQKEEN